MRPKSLLVITHHIIRSHHTFFADHYTLHLELQSIKSFMVEEIPKQFPSLSVEKYPNNPMLGTREFVDGKHGKYVWLTYKQVYDKVIRVGNSIHVVAQAQVITTLKLFPRLLSIVNALSNLLCDSQAFWRVRIEAAFALATTASENVSS
ncbi:hypothetical protein L2E82_51122 [Cichorium intybus]|nr:hypothetical protein L2E82_51122 [Cichorium intybus]